MAARPAIAAPAVSSTYLSFDRDHTRFGFELRTRWGQRVTGQFPRYDGELELLPDGKRQVRILLDTDAVVVADSEQYTGMARGEKFFDSVSHPLVRFVSHPYDPALAHDGGRLRGILSMHGTSRLETFTLQPSACSRPGLDCDVVVRGSVDRRNYGLDGWGLVLGSQVYFTMRVRLMEAS